MFINTNILEMQITQIYNNFVITKRKMSLTKPYYKMAI